MKLTAEQIQMNWVEFTTNIETYITGDRKQNYLIFITNIKNVLC
jgi:hypothetical protein